MYHIRLQGHRYRLDVVLTKSHGWTLHVDREIVFVIDCHVMPRFLPRLIKRLTEQPLSELVYSGKNIKRTRKRISFYRPIPNNTSFDHGRPQSILLAGQNPITNSRSYAPHKRLPPRVYLASSRQHRTGGHPDAPRAMTDEERQWWSSPYRMYAP